MTTDNAFDGFKWSTLEEGRSGMWIAEAFLDTLNWFPDASEDERIALAARALRELHNEGFVLLRDTTTGKELTGREVESS
jgi:hypothetical protein